MVTGVESTLICVLLLTFLLYWKKKEDACHQKILNQLEEILIRFRENKFDALLKTENHAELEKLNDQLEAIGHHNLMPELHIKCIPFISPVFILLQ